MSDSASNRPTTKEIRIVRRGANNSAVYLIIVNYEASVFYLIVKICRALIIVRSPYKTSSFLNAVNVLFEKDQGRVDRSTCTARTTVLFTTTINLQSSLD